MRAQGGDGRTTRTASAKRERGRGGGEERGTLAVLCSHPRSPLAFICSQSCTRALGGRKRRMMVPGGTTSFDRKSSRLAHVRLPHLYVQGAGCDDAAADLAIWQSPLSHTRLRLGGRGPRGEGSRGGRGGQKRPSMNDWSKCLLDGALLEPHAPFVLENSM
jgi:hypothetical protein